jgi:hypothetical protein
MVMRSKRLEKIETSPKRSTVARKQRLSNALKNWNNGLARDIHDDPEGRNGIPMPLKLELLTAI